MRKLLYIFIFLSMSFQGCNVFKHSISKDMIASASKTLLDRTIRKLFNADTLSLEKDSIYIDGLIKADKAKKILGRKVSNFLTRNGSIYFKTDSLELHLEWKELSEEDRGIKLQYYKR